MGLRCPRFCRAKNSLQQTGEVADASPCGARACENMFSSTGRRTERLPNRHENGVIYCPLTLLCR